MNLEGLEEVRLVQRWQLEELVGVEARSKYEIRDARGRPLGFAAEQVQGFLGTVARNVLGHWRQFEVRFFDMSRQVVLRVHHPFRFLLQRLEVFDAQGRPLGALQQRFAFLARSFAVEDADGEVVMEMRTPIFRAWTYPFMRDGVEQARVDKQWGGLMSQGFSDADTFRVVLGPTLSAPERWLMLAAAVFVDLQYFEKKAGTD